MSGKLNKEDCVLFSGAAQGAESAFGAAAERHGVEEVNFTFEGHQQVRRRGLRALNHEELQEGDVACFKRGREGLHQVRNATEEPIRVLMLSTLLAPDVVEYADSGKVSVVDAKGKRLFREFRGPDAEYWEGES